MIFDKESITFFENGFKRYRYLYEKSQPKVTFSYRKGNNLAFLHDMTYISPKVLDVKHVEGVLEILIDGWDKTEIKIKVIVGKESSGMRIPVFQELIKNVCTYVMFLNQIRRKSYVEIVCAFSKTKKEIPESGILGVENVNSGFSVGDYVFIYRQEEFYKVLLHELIHYYGFHDNIEDDMMGATDMIKTFNIQNTKPLRLYESYVETITSIWMIFFKAKKMSKGNNIEPKDLIELYRKTIKHMIETICLILKYNGRGSMMDTSNPLKENTHVFSYYFVKGAIMLNIKRFIELYGIGMIPSKIFNKTYASLIKSSLNDKRFNNVVSKTMNTVYGNSLRMMPFDL